MVRRLPWSLPARLFPLAILLATLPGSVRGQDAQITSDPPRSAGARELARLRARVAALSAGAEMLDDGSLDLSPAQTRAVAALDCPRALAVAAMTAEERAAELAQIPDPEDPDLGYEEQSWAFSARLEIEENGIDGAIPRSLACRRAVDRARVHLTLGADAGLVFLLEAVRTREPGASELEAGLTAQQRELYALLAEMDGDFSRARAPSLAMLLRALTLTIHGQECTARSPDLRVARDADGMLQEVREPLAGFVLIGCATDRGDFHESWAYSVVSLVAHVGSEGARVVDRLRDRVLSSNDVLSGELVRGAHASGDVVAIEVELGASHGGQRPDVASAMLLVCSRASARCRRADLGFDDGRSRWALVGPSFALIDPTRFTVQAAVDVERWIAREVDLVTDPPRPEPASHLAPGRASWAVRDLTEAEGCRFVVTDPRGPLHVRTHASAGSEILGELPIGTAVRAAETAEGWIRIDAPIAGWLHRSGLQRACIEDVAVGLTADDEGGSPADVRPR